ncbi:MAG: hypothetical protein QXU98_02765 [Candidatus Parvarchaeota archaeon]
MTTENKIESKSDELKTVKDLEEYVRQSREIIEKIIGLIASDRNDPTQKEWIMIKIIADKVIEPFYYWRNETDSNMVSRKELDIYELSEKFDLDLSAYPSRIGLKRMIVREDWLQLLNILRMKGFSYESSSRSFVPSIK